METLPAEYSLKKIFQVAVVAVLVGNFCCCCCCIGGSGCCCGGGGAAAAAGGGRCGSGGGGGAEGGRSGSGGSGGGGGGGSGSGAGCIGCGATFWGRLSKTLSALCMSWLRPKFNKGFKHPLSVKRKLTNGR